MLNRNAADNTFTFDDAELGNEKMMNVDVSDPSTCGDQLPNVDEYKASVSGSSVPSKKQFKLYTVVGVSILIIVIITIGAIVGSKKKESGNSTQSNNDSNETRLQQALAVIGTGYYSSGDLFQLDPNDPSKLQDGWNTPQSQAAYWIANVDPLQIPMEQSLDFVQRYVLAVLYFMTNGVNDGFRTSTDGWTDFFSFLSVQDVCDWNNAYFPEEGGPKVTVGVMCNDNKEIERIWIPNNNLVGRLPTELRLLTQLKEMNFYNNLLFGKIPGEYIQLQNLEAIVFYQNQLQDTFPTWLGSLPNLAIVNFGKNDIDGTLPDSIKNINRLQVLNCDSCILTGGIEAALKGTASLQSLQLGNNNLNGTLSYELLLSLPNLMELDMNSNRFTGTLPYNLLTQNTNLMVVDLHDNNFTGQIIEQAFISNPRNITNLRVLSLAGNELTGTIEWIEYFPELRHLDLSFNPLSGPIPATIGNLTELRYLFLAMNDKYTPGPIPTEIGLLTNLTDLSFQKSNRNGPIPIEIGELKHLVLLDLQNNSFTGSIPTQFGALKSINFLLANDNQLTGALPDGLITDKLDTLTIQGNKDVTSVPSMICIGNDKVRTINVDFIQLDDTSKAACSCCSRCDDPTAVDTTCNTFFFGNMDPTPEYNYARVYYQLYEGDSLIPVDNTPFENLPMFGGSLPNNPLFGDNYNNADEEFKYLLEHMNAFGGLPNTTDPNGGLSKPWEEIQQDFNYTDDYLEKYVENYLQDYLDDKDFADYFDDKYFDDQYIDDLYMDDNYNDDFYGNYNEDRPNATLDATLEYDGGGTYIDIKDPIDLGFNDDGK